MASLRELKLRVEVAVMAHSSHVVVRFHIAVVVL